MKKALVVGGNSGIGLSIVSHLLLRGVEKIIVVGKDEIDLSDVSEDLKQEFKDRVVCHTQNFVSLDLDVFKDAEDIDTLIITTGFGRVALFEDLTDAEVNNLIKVNFESVARIIKHFYHRIANHKDFYTAVLVSICGQIVSPFFSVYGAAKGGLRYLIENLNCELNSNHYSNRILDVSPGSLKGTAFSGGKNNLSLLDDISENIIDKMLSRETIYIPKYEEIYKDVLSRYFADRTKFGLDSYKFKVESGRITNRPQVTIGYLSGTFDLFHIGHLNLLRRAKEQCDYLIVSVHNSGAWKGKETFIPYEERRAIVESIKYVDEVVEDFREDYDAWDKYHYDKLFVGSDYKGTERFNRYEELLRGKAEIVYFPYTKGTSSTQLREAISKKK